MKSASPYYAQSSGNTFYFRSKIPSDLRDHFGGKESFKISLKCAIKSRSSKVTKSLNRIVSRLYDQIRQGMKELDIEEIKEILRGGRGCDWGSQGREKTQPDQGGNQTPTTTTDREGFREGRG